MFLKHHQKVGRRQDLGNETRCAREVANVVRDNRVAFCRNGELEDEFVPRIRQCRSPQKMNVLAMGDLAQIIDQALGVAAAQAERIGVSNSHRWVLQGQWHGHRDVESMRPQELQEPE